MKLEDVRNIAKIRGIHPGEHSKTELIKMLQAEEGNFDCFATPLAANAVKRTALWREDSFDAAQKGELS